jgi:hypothetical protein
MKMDVVFNRLFLAKACEPFTNRIRITSAIRDRPYPRSLVFLIVKDDFWELYGVIRR